MLGRMPVIAVTVDNSKLCETLLDVLQVSFSSLQLLCCMSVAWRSATLMIHVFSPLCIVQVEEFDYFIRKKDQGKAETGLAEAKTALDKVLSAVA